jgi:hypothetical protein
MKRVSFHLVTWSAEINEDRIVKEKRRMVLIFVAETAAVGWPLANMHA